MIHANPKTCLGRLRTVSPRCSLILIGRRFASAVIACCISTTPARRARGGGAVCRCAETKRRWRHTRRDIGGGGEDSQTEADCQQSPEFSLCTRGRSTAVYRSFAA